MELPEFAKQKEGSVKDFLAVIGGGHANFYECQDARQMMRIFDITTESKPVGVSTWTVPEESGDFCTRGGYFSTHASNQNFTSIYYDRLLFIAHHNAGARAVDIRDPYNPKEIGYYIPAANSMTRELRGQRRGAALQDRDRYQQSRGGRPRLTSILPTRTIPVCTSWNSPDRHVKWRISRKRMEQAQSTKLSMDDRRPGKHSMMSGSKNRTKGAANANCQ